MAERPVGLDAKGNEVPVGDLSDGVVVLSAADDLALRRKAESDIGMSLEELWEHLEDCGCCFRDLPGHITWDVADSLLMWWGPLD